MDEKLIQLATLLSEECDWPIDIDDLDSSWGGPFWNYSKEELGLPDDMDIELAGYELIPPQGFEDKMRIYFLSIEGTGRLHVTRLRAILKELARKGRRVRAGEGGAIDVGVEDIIFVCSLLEPKNATRYFCHFQDKEDGKRPKLMIGPRWEDTQPEAEKERAVARLRDNLQWPDDGTSLDVWREEWSKAFTVEHLYVPKTSKQLANRLAVLAAQIRESIAEIHALENGKGPIHSLLKAFREALIKDLKLPDFADMVAQTISYGLFSARATGSELSGIETLAECIPSTNPFLRDLFSEFFSLAGDNPTDLDFDDLSLDELVEMLNVCNIDAIMDEFGSQFKGGKKDPLIYFYEEFLEIYDKDQRKDRGVWYTPRPVVDFIVKRVHDGLIKNHNLPLGLADASTSNIEGKEWHQVIILDPAVGTGTFLCSAIRIIYETMKEHWNDGGFNETEIVELWNKYVDKSLIPRLIGFEIMMAPYTIAHININLQLKLTGYSLDSERRLNVVLTNTLDPIFTITDSIPDYLSEEAKLGQTIKEEFPISVIIGNPPYSGETSNDIEWINQLIRTDLPDGSSSYFQIGGHPLNEKNPKWLNDDYVKFMRFSQYVLSKREWGVLGFINNHGWLDNPTFRGMRESILESFNRIDVIDLHGNVKKKEVSPTGSNENVFPIQQGVCVNIFQKSSIKEQRITHADIWGTKIEKEEALKNDEFESETIEPSSPGYLIHPIDLDLITEYRNGIPINDLFPLSSLGIVTARDKLTIGWNDKEIWDRISHFVSLKEESARSEYNLRKDARDWKVRLAQEDIRSTGPSKNLIQSIHYRAWDFRTTYYTGKTRGFHCMPRPMVMSNMINLDNIGLISRRQMTGSTPNFFFVTDRLISDGVIRSDNKGGESLYPLFISVDKGTSKFIDNTKSLKSWEPKNGIIPNLNHPFIQLLSKRLKYKFKADKNDGKHQCWIVRAITKDIITPYDIFCYGYAAFYSNSYRTKYSDYIMKSYPRLQFTTDRKLFSKLVNAGSKLIRSHLLEFKHLEPLEIVGENFMIMAGYPKHIKQEIHLNKGTKIKNISNDLWEYKIGVHQVLEKWLKDRKERVLSQDEIQHYGKIIQAVKHTLMHADEIDKIIQDAGGFPLKGHDQFSGYEGKIAGQSSIMDF